MRRTVVHDDCSNAVAIKCQGAVGLSFSLLCSLLYLSCQVGCSDGLDAPRLRLEPGDARRGGTVLLHLGEGVVSLDIARKSLSSIVAASSSEGGSPGMASFSPDASEIAFKEEAGERGDSLVVLNLKDGARRVLLEMPFLDGTRWSPDGTRIAFEGRSVASGDYSLYQYTLESGKLSPIVEGELKGGEMLFSWAPDAKRIVFQSVANDIYLLDLTTRQRARIDSGWFPTSSPNGQYIAYRADGADDPGYIVYDLQARKGERILRRRSVYRSLIWSPDSRYLIYAADGRGEYYGDLFILDLQAKKETRVLRRKESVYPTDWTKSPLPAVRRP